MEVDDEITFPQDIETLILQNILQNFKFKDENIRFNLTKIWLYLLLNPRNSKIINHDIIKLAKSSNAIVKGPILQQIKTAPDFDLATLDYVALFCKND